jgi:hypothetical protein
MQSYSVVARDLASVCKLTVAQPWVRRGSLGLAAAIALMGLGSQSVVQAQGYDVVPPLPAGVIPVPGAAMPQAPVSGQQYVVFVNDTSETTLQQVQMIEPTAFRTSFQGRPVIQAGRFNHSANAQQRVNDLASRGVMAQMSAAPAAQPVFAQTPALPGNVYASSGQLPPLPGVTVIPPQGTAGLPALPPPAQTSPVPLAPTEFGQQLTYAAPATPNAYPVNMPPPASTALAAPAAAPVANAPFYVVIPTSAANLQTLSAQVIQLGTPGDRVQARTEPRGPHVAVGPFADRGLAEQWSDFYRSAGIGGSRVFYQR